MEPSFREDDVSRERPPLDLSKMALLLFGSGLCALTYQVAWMRELRQIFGISTSANAAVLAIFMGGLGLGSAYLGKRADRHTNPLAFYGRLELSIAFLSALTLVLVLLARAVYVALGGTAILGPVGSIVVRLFLSALVLGPVTFLMGGTLPAAARAIEEEGDLGRRRLALLYGVNTLGAVTGAALTTFLLLEVLGVKRTLGLASTVNLGIALLALRWAQRAESVNVITPEAQRQPTRDQPPPCVPPAFVLASSALVGFAFFLMEIVWYRMLSPILGGSSYSFGLILVIALLGIGLGGYLYSLGDFRRIATLGGFALTCSLEALFLIGPFALGDLLAIHAALLHPLSTMGFIGQIEAWALIALFVVFPPAFVSGIQFPLLIGLLGSGREEVGSHTGAAYAFNTLGAILGSLTGGFGLLPLLSAPGAWRFTALTLATLGIVSALLSVKWRPYNRFLAFLALLSASIAIWISGLEGPTGALRHSPIGAGRVALAGMSRNGIQGWLNERRRSVVKEVEGIESAVGITGGDGFALVINGKSDGHCRGDAPTMIMSGLIGAALHEKPETALVVGLGTGETAGWLAADPRVMQVDVVELEPAVTEVARLCSVANLNVMANPKVRFIFGDAREYILVTPHQYDIIFSQPSNPYRAGVANLFTTDFYEAVRGRLREGGIFLQWLQAYEVDPWTVKTIYASLRRVFPIVETFLTDPNDLLLVARTEPPEYDAFRLRSRLDGEPFGWAMDVAWGVQGLEGFLSRYVAGPKVADFLAEGMEDFVSTDDRTTVEFDFARNVGRHGLFKMSEFLSLSEFLEDDRPNLMGGEVDWERVRWFRVSMGLELDQPPIVFDRGSVEGREAAVALGAYVRGDLKMLRETWKQKRWEPLGRHERVAIAEALADGGDQEALALIEGLDRAHEVEAHAVRARFFARNDRTEEGTQELLLALTKYRDDPWPMRVLMVRTLDLAVEIAKRDPVLGERIYQALSKPFALNNLEDRRNQARFAIASRVNFKGLCLEALRPFEEHPPWDFAFLARRLECYKAHGHPLTSRTEKDLAKFLALSPPKLSPPLSQPVR